MDYPTSSSRFDLYVKLMLIRKGFDDPLALDCYREIVGAFSFGEFTEPGSPEKVGYSAFINEFQTVYLSIKNNGYLRSAEPIPLAIDGTILNGSHRLASCIALRTQPTFVQTSQPPEDYSFKFFVNRGVGNDILREVASHIPNEEEEARLAILWPTAYSHQKAFEQLDLDILYKEEVSLDLFGLTLLITQTYPDDPWIGTPPHFKGAFEKATQCFASHPVTIYLVVPNPQKSLTAIKEIFRSKCCLGKAALHTTDTQIETGTLAATILNKNWIALCQKTINQSLTTRALQKLYVIKKQYPDKLDQLMLDGSTVLMLHGLRDAEDLDIIIKPNHPELDRNFNDINIRTEDQLKFYKTDINNLFRDSRNYMIIFGIKIASIELVKEFKINRQEKKDKSDLILIGSLKAPHQIDIFILRAEAKIRIFRTRSRRAIVEILICIRIYPILKKIYQYVVSK